MSIETATGLETGQPYPYQRVELVEPDWTRFPGWKDVTAEEVDLFQAALRYAVAGCFCGGARPHPQLGQQCCPLETCQILPVRASAVHRITGISTVCCAALAILEPHPGLNRLMVNTGIGCGRRPDRP